MADDGKRNWLLVLPVTGMGIGYLVLLGYLLWCSVPGLTAAATDASPTPTRVLVDLWNGYEQARAAAQVQAPDAQLVSASTQWQVVSEDALLDGASSWSFVFYSPASSSSLDVVVDAGTAQVVNQTRVWVAPGALTEAAWQAGPRDALLVFLAYDGRPFLHEHPQAMVDLHLAEGGERGPVWTIVALDPEDRSLLSTLVDASTGQVLSEVHSEVP